MTYSDALPTMRPPLAHARPRTYRRLRLLQRLGLVGPLLRLHRKLEGGRR
jgi:hypothetical protein